MKTLVFVLVVLLVYCTAVCASQENDQVPMTTGELRKELNRAGHAILTTFFLFLIPGYTPSHPAYSCNDIFQLAPQSPSGLYWISGTDNKPKHMYCDMERSCKGVAGGWMRVASINMTDTSSTCPSGLRTLTTPRRLCAKNTDHAGCSSTVFPVQGIEYTQVCGKIIGYQQKAPNAFYRTNSAHDSIESYYVDGISITHGLSPRQHIWTFVAALHEDDILPLETCACTNTRSSQHTPST